MNYIDEVALNNSLEKLRYFENLSNVDLENLKKSFVELQNCYKSNINDTSNFNYILNKNNKSILLIHTKKIKFLKTKLDNYKIANIRAKKVLGE